MSEAHSCEAFLSWQQDGKQVVCGQPASFTRRRQEPLQPTEGWDGEPFYLCAEHAGRAFLERTSGITKT